MSLVGVTSEGLLLPEQAFQRALSSVGDDSWHLDPCRSLGWYGLELSKEPQQWLVICDQVERTTTQVGMEAFDSEDTC